MKRILQNTLLRHFISTNISARIFYIYVMASPGQKHGSCEHIMAVFDKCVRCHEKGISTDPCVLNIDCDFCNTLTSDQKAQLSTRVTNHEKQKKTATPQLPEP